MRSLNLSIFVSTALLGMTAAAPLSSVIELINRGDYPPIPCGGSGVRFNSLSFLLGYRIVLLMFL